MTGWCAPGCGSRSRMGFANARELLRLADPSTAVVCGNDLQAFGVYEAARQAGARIP